MQYTQKKDLVSVIIPVKNEGSLIEKTIQSLKNSKTNINFEIIVVDDASIDNCCAFLKKEENSSIKLIRANSVGSSMARNIGALQAKGEIYIFCDGHIIFENYWLDKLIEPIVQCKADAVNPGIADILKPLNIGYGYTWNDRLEPKWNTKIQSFSPSPLLAGGCLAISKEAFLMIDGFEKGFKIWGREDEEISLKLWLFGYKCYIQPTVKVFHYFRPGKQPYPLTNDHVNYNLLRMAYNHFNETRIEKCRKIIKTTELKNVENLIFNSNVNSQRNHYLKMRKYDDDWFMSKFHINF